MRFLLAALLGALTVVSGGEACAEDSPRQESAAFNPEPASEPTSTVSAQIDARAALLYRDAEEKYGAGNVAGALEQMQLCYDVSGRPELLFNLGQLHQELRHCERALSSYREYLARSPAPAHRDEATSAITELSRECTERASPPALVSVPAQPAQPSAPPVAPTYWTPMRTVGWSAIAAAVLAGSGATYLALRAASRETALEQRFRELQSSKTGAGFEPADKQLEASGKRAATWAQVLGVSAAGIATAGVTLLVISSPKRETRAPALSLALGSGSVSALYSGAF